MLDANAKDGFRCKLLWPRVHPYTQPTSSQPPPEKERTILVRTNGLVDEESREGKSKPGCPGVPEKRGRSGDPPKLKKSSSQLQEEDHPILPPTNTTTTSP